MSPSVRTRLPLTNILEFRAPSSWHRAQESDAALTASTPKRVRSPVRSVKSLSSVTSGESTVTPRVSWNPWMCTVSVSWAQMTLASQARAIAPTTLETTHRFMRVECGRRSFAAAAAALQAEAAGRALA